MDDADQSPVLERLACQALWHPQILGDPVVATALLDRLLHHAVVVQIEGSSYRLRQHADLLAQPRHPGQASTIETPPRRRGRPPKGAAQAA